MIKGLKDKLKLSTNRKNIVKISSGSLVGQIISIITLPIITRIYGAEIIGTWALINSAAMIINSFSDLGLSYSLMVEDDAHLEKSYKVISTISLIISVLSGIILTLFHKFFLGNNHIAPILLLCFLIFIVFTLQQIQICYTWLNRNGQYTVLMKNPVIHNGVYGVLAIVLGLLGYKIYGYVIARIVGQLLTLINMKRYLPKEMFTFSMSDFKNALFQNRRFVQYQMPTNVIGKVKTNLPTLLIKAFWGSEVLGYYAVTVKLLQMPSTLLASAIGRVFFQTTAAMKREGKDIGKFVYTNILRAIKLAFVPVTLLIAFGDIFASAFLGKEWIVAGVFIRILALQTLFTFLMTSTQGLAITLKKQHYALFSLIAQIMVISLGHIFGKYIFFDINISLLLMTVLQIVINIIYFSMLFKVMDINWEKYLKVIIITIFMIIALSALLRHLVINMGILILS